MYRYVVAFAVDLTIALQVPASTHLPLSHSPSAQATTGESSDLHSRENVSVYFCNQHYTLTFYQYRRTQASSATYTPPPVSVPHAQGREVCSVNFSLSFNSNSLTFQRNATAGAPRGDRGYVRDEEFNPPSPHPSLPQPSTTARDVRSKRGRWWLCWF
jgi:hypothetical protein